jgi:hypothetical protein
VDVILAFFADRIAQVAADIALAAARAGGFVR